MQSRKRSAKPGEARAFAEKALTHAGDECLLWPFSCDPDGYGYLQAKGRRKCWRVHRWVCEKVHGEKPSPAHGALHSCGNQSCVNPNHLRWGVARENSEDMKRHGNSLLGEKNPGSRISADMARRIYNAKGKQADIAEKYGVSKGHVCNIKRGWSWSSETGAPRVER